MVLNYLWIGFFLVAFIVGLIKLIFFQDYEVFGKMMNGGLEMSKTAFNLSLGLTGALCFWLGIMKIGENGGAIRLLSKLVSPLFRRLFPDIPKNHEAVGSIMMNFSANMLGLDNAATPLGLKAMRQLQELNEAPESPTKENAEKQPNRTASNSQIMFLVLNTSGLTIIPVSVLALRLAEGSDNPAEVFIPILLATYFATLAGLVVTSIFQKIYLFNRVILAYVGGATLLIGGLIYYLQTLNQEQISRVSDVGANLILFGIIIAFILLGMRKKVDIYNSFIEGAKEGFQVAVKIIPFLVAMLVAIKVFRESGSLDFIVGGISSLIGLFTEHTEFVDALPTAFMRPLSGSGARGMMTELWVEKSNVELGIKGVDSFAGKVAAVFQGSTETTFYTLAVYYGAVGIRNTRYTVICGLIADCAGIIAAILISYLFFQY